MSASMSPSASEYGELEMAPPLVGRALLALVLLIGFYVLALVISAGLLLLLWAETKSPFINLYVTLACLLGPVIILVSIFPRSIPFVAPGPRITRKSQPRFFALLDEVARSTKQRVPNEVYVDFQVNAGVTQRGGLLSLFSRRVMIVGLPLLQVLSVSQLKSVIAHEFGHYDGGDTLLGPLVYQTRTTIFRTVAALEASGSFVNAPFELYGELYLRLTQAVSRAQERRADRVACRVAGSRACWQALWRMEAADLILTQYWDDEVVPILKAGYRPPIAAGFGRYVDAAAATPQFAERVWRNLEKEEPHEYDSHPPTRERIAAMRRYAAPDDAVDDRPAIALFDRVEDLEGAILDDRGGRRAAELKPITWAEVTARVYLPTWNEQLRKHQAALAGLTIHSLPSVATVLLPLAERLHFALSFRDTAKKQAAEVLAMALTAALVRQGWTPRTAPGEPTKCRRGEVEVDPLQMIEQITTGKVAARDWIDHCASLGIANAPLMPTAGA